MELLGGRAWTPHQGGASPLAFPAFPNAALQSYSPTMLSNGKEKDTSRELLEGVLPRTDVLNRSEFILPLTPVATMQYNKLLTDLSTSGPKK